jgi:hypothetical protein
MFAWRRGLALALLAWTGVFAGANATAAEASGVAAFRWVDENGVVHYGDHIPAKYATKESTLINKNGVEIGRTEAQRSPEQIADDERRQQALIRQKQHDAFLLTTYTSVKDIESLRDERLVQISGQRRAAEQYVEGLHSRLNTLQSRAKAFKPYSDNPDARRMPDDLAEDLVRTLNEMRTQRNALAVKDAEETTLRQQFQADIERYRELKKTVSR